MPHGPSQQHLHTMTESDRVITTSDPYSGGSMFDCRPLCVPPTFHACKCWSSHSWMPCMFRCHASIIIHSHRYMNAAGLTEVSLSKAKIKNTAEGMRLAKGVQMVTLDCKNQCAITLSSLTLRRLMSYIYGAPILDVSRSHTTTQHSR